MVYLKNIKRSQIKQWILQLCGASAKHVFDIHIKYCPERSILIRTKPHMLNHPFRMWIMSVYDSNVNPTGKVWINDQAVKHGIHYATKLSTLKNEFTQEMYKWIMKLHALADKSEAVRDINYSHFMKIMHKLGFKSSKQFTNKQQGNFKYIPSRHSKHPSVPNIFFNTKKRILRVDIDGSTKQYDLYNKVSNYVDDYFNHETGKGIAKNTYTIVNDKTINKAMNHMLKLLKSDAVTTK